MRPEHKLLLNCIQHTINSERTSDMRALIERGVEWQYLLTTALQHGVMPVLYRSLNRYPDAVPTEVFNQLRRQFHINTGRNLFMTTELLKLLDLFTTHEIPAFPFKGPVLDAYLNQDVVSRQCGDLDIMVRTQDVTRAQELLLSQGYQPHVHLTSTQHTFFLRSEYELPFVRKDGNCVVELHWRITPQYFSFSLDFEHLWERLEPVSFNGREVLTLSSEDLVLILAMHGTRHLWQRLGWVCDVATLISNHKEIDWDWVIEQAHRLGSERMLSLALFLTRDLLEVDLPEQVVERVQSDPVVTLLAAQVRQRLFDENGRWPGVLGTCLFHLRTRERLLDRIRYCLHQATTPSILDWMRLPLPPFLYSLYHLFRPMRLFLRHGVALIKRLLLRVPSS